MSYSPIAVLLALSVSLCWSSALCFAGQVSVERKPLTRVLSDEGGKLRTVSITNALADRTLKIAGPEFTLTWGDGKSATSDDFALKSLQATDQGAVAELENIALGLKATITYWQPPAQPAGQSQDRPVEPTWLYKQIRFTNTGSAPFLLRTVEVEHLTIAGEKVTFAVDPAFGALGDWGQPVYTESLWLGLEFPASRSSATADGVIFLRHHPGIELAPGQSYETKRAVLGPARAGEVAAAFMEYIRTLAPRTGAPRAHLYWDGFRVIMPPDRTSQGLRMIKTAAKLKEQTGFTFDAWTYDAGFDMYRADALFAPNEADIWDRTAEALKPINTPLGMWCSFSCIFDTQTQPWGKTQGYELQHDNAYCLAGPKYFAAIKARLVELVSRYHMNSINFDGMYWGQGFGCNLPGHGHLVGQGSETGVYSLERVVENKLDIFHALRQINPGIVLDLFICNEWSSPWWLTELDGVHTVAGDTLGCDIPSPWLRDELITVRDIQVFDEHRRLRRQFPLWGEDLYGSQVRKDHLIDGVNVTGEAMTARWEDEFVMAYPGRGAISPNGMCSDLEVLDQSRSGLKFLGGVGLWVRANEKLYRDAQLLGGEPVKREAYGYSHSDGAGRCLVALRNPWIEPRQFALTLDATLGLKPGDAQVFVNVVYPYRKTFAAAKYGATVEIPLPDYAVMLLEVRTAARQFAGAPEGQRWTVDDAGKLVTFDEAPLAAAATGGLTAIGEPKQMHLSGSVTVPAGARGEVQVILKPIVAGMPAPTASIDGQPAKLELHRRDRGGGSDGWALVSVPPGTHKVDVILPAQISVETGAWLVATYTLKGAPAGKPLPDATGLFPIFAPDEDRRVVTLLAPGKQALPIPPLPNDPNLMLSDMQAYCTEATVGFSHFGWDESGWPADRVLRIGKATYKKGLGVHAPAVASFALDGSFKRFTAEVGMHGVPPEAKGDKGKIGSCAFIVEGDGKKLFESPVRREGDPPLHVEVDIAGVRKLTLRTTNGGDSNYDDLATWGDARIER